MRSKRKNDTDSKFTYLEQIESHPRSPAALKKRKRKNLTESFKSEQIIWNKYIQMKINILDRLEK